MILIQQRLKLFVDLAALIYFLILRLYFPIKSYISKGGILHIIALRLSFEQPLSFIVICSLSFCCRQVISEIRGIGVFVFILNVA